MKIAVLSTEYLKDYLTEAFEKLDLGCETEIFIYYNYVHIVDLYRQLEERFDGFITTGPVPMQTVKKSVPNCRPISFFLCSESNYYKTFFEVIYKYQDWNFEYGYFDFCDYLCPGQESSLVDHLKNGTFGDWLDRNNRFMENMTVERMQESTRKKLEKHIRLWKEGKIKYSLSRMSPIMPQILEAGVDCHYISFSYDDIVLCFRKLIQEILMSQLKDSQPASIEILLSGCLQEQADCDRKKDVLERLLKAFNKRYLCDFIIYETKNGFRISTSHKTVERITDSYTDCRLRAYLEKNGKLSVALGYGEGGALSLAQANAIDAARESQINGSKTSYFFGGDRKLVGLFGSGNDFSVQGSVTPYVRELSDRTGLSTLTIQKLISAFHITGTDEVTTPELARVLHITIRSVNRLISVLVKYNLAEPLYSRQTNTKGRPSRVYRIMIRTDS